MSERKRQDRMRKSVHEIRERPMGKSMVEVIANILKQYGPWALLLVVFVYILVNGQLTFRYPRQRIGNDTFCKMTLL